MMGSVANQPDDVVYLVNPNQQEVIFDMTFRGSAWTVLLDFFFH